MDRTTARNHARQLAEYVRARPAVWQAIVDQRTIPVEFLPDHHRAFHQQSMQEYAKLMAPLVAMLADAKAAVPPKPLLRARDAAENIRVAAELQELTLRTPAGIVSRIGQAIEEDDAAFLSRAVPVLKDRQIYAKPLQGHIGLSNALVDAEAALAAVPEVVAREQALQAVAEFEGEVSTLGRIVTAKDPAAELDVYVATGNFPVLLPKP